jgi:hypothetical protein
MDLHRSGVPATLVTATEDRILNSTSLQEHLHLLPADLTQVSIVVGRCRFNRRVQTSQC